MRIGECKLNVEIVLTRMRGCVRMVGMRVCRRLGNGRLGNAGVLGNLGNLGYDR